MFKIVCALTLFAAQAFGQVSYAQRAVLYEGLNQQDEFIIIPQTYVPDLAQYNFANRARSVCVTGVWLFYVETNYNLGVNGGMEYVFGANEYCVNLKTVAGYVRSIRFVGSPTDYRADTLTFFENSFFQGNEEYTFTDLPNLNLQNNHKSLVITGATAWTVYDTPNYLGNSICLYPPPSNNFTPYFLSDLNNVQIPYGSIKSVRKGCYQKPDSNNNVEEFARAGSV